MTWFTESNNQSAATAAHAEIVYFVELEFPSGTLRMHTGVGTVQWGAGSPIPEWYGVGKLGGIAPIKEDTELRPNGLTLTLSGVDSDLITAAMTEDYHNQPVRVYIGFRDTSTFALTADPELAFSGVMDYMTISQGEQFGTITVHCESEFARWARPRTLLFTRESQQLLYDGDLGLDFVAIIQSRVVTWDKRVNVGGNSGSYGGGGGFFRTSVARLLAQK